MSYWRSSAGFVSPEIDDLRREFLWVEALARSLAHLAVLFESRLGGDFDQVRVAKGTTAEPSGGQARAPSTTRGRQTQAGTAAVWGVQQSAD